ncbi:MAG TPA: DoxX family protein [Pyrinomonadaceae bacterium]|nr:DoxX family protein [Pyrinomonadaceae bacterium]
MPESSTSISKGARIAGWILSILPCLLLTVSAVMKFIQPAGFDEGLKHMGWDAGVMKYIGVVELACVVIYLFPRTAVLGAILITGYMGGAMATHVRVGDPFFVQLLVGVVAWAGLWLRDARVKNLIPLN